MYLKRKRKKTEGSRGDVRLDMARLLPSSCSVSPFLYSPLVSSTSTHSLIVLAAGLWSENMPPSSGGKSTQIINLSESNNTTM